MQPINQKKPEASFNPRSHVGSDAANQPKTPEASFNPRSHVGSDIDAPKVTNHFAVSIHAPAWGATFVKDLPDSDILFQSTLPHGERRFSFVLSGCFVSFNPRSRMGSDFLLKLSLQRPLWFQSTLPHGERLYFARGQTPPAEFQSTLPHGERLKHT